MSPSLWIPYLRFLLSAKGRHGLHSPFAYGFVENVLRAGDFADSASAATTSVPLPASAYPAFRPQDFQYLIRLIAYWQPVEIRLFPEVVKAGAALERLFPSIPVRKAEEGTTPDTPVLWVGKITGADPDLLPATEALIWKALPVSEARAVVLLGASSSRFHREQAERLLMTSGATMGIDFWNGIFLASDPRFLVRQRFSLKPFF